MTVDVQALNEFVLIGSAVTLLAILAVRLSSRAGLPSLLIYLLMGVALGEAGLGIPFEDAELTQALGFAALAVILAEGGLTTNWRQMRSSIRLGASLATLGIVVSVTLVAVAGHYLLGLPWQLAVLLGAVCSPTDAAAVFSVLRVVPLPKRLTGALEAESGLNDAPTVVLVVLVSTGAVSDHHPGVVVAMVVGQLLGGVAVGLAAGFGGAWLMRRAAQYDKSGDGHYNLISALHKSVRGSDPDAALYWFARMLEGGEDPRFLGRRLTRMAVEDIGLADPQAQAVCLQSWETYERLGSPEGELALAQAVIYLALAPKSNAAYVAYKAARKSAKATGSVPPPKHILNAPTSMMKEQGYGKGYAYDHDAEDGFSGQDYFPETLERTAFYAPVERGFERDLKKRVEYFAKLRSKR